MKSLVKISSPNGVGAGTEVIVDGHKVDYLTGVDVSIGVVSPNTVRLHLVAHAQAIEIGAEIRIGGAVIPAAVEIAMLAYLQKKYPE